MVKYQYIQNAFHSDLKPRARLVLNCLILHANKDGECFPSIKTIGAECGYGVSTVKRALNDLCDAGYLQKQARFDERKKGGQTSNLYILILTADSVADHAENKPESTETVAKLDNSTEIRIIRKSANIHQNGKLPSSRGIDFSGLLMWTGVQSNFVPP
jgi:DNA-binding MurR/RpiR family transcriptional regulator